MNNNTSHAVRLSNQDSWLQSLIETPEFSFFAPITNNSSVRLIRLDEINEDGHKAYSQALANVYATLPPDQSIRLAYILDGRPTGVSLYFGVTADSREVDLHEAMKNLCGALEGQLPGIIFEKDNNGKHKDVTQEECRQLLTELEQAKYQGVVLGAPTVQTQETQNDEDNFQGLDRLVRALQSGSRTDSQGDGHWKLIVISQPITRQKIRQLLDEAYILSSRLTALVRTSIQTSGNTSRQKSSSVGASDSNGTNVSVSSNWGKNEGGTDSKSQGQSSGKNFQTSSTGTNTGSSQTKTVGTSEGSSKNFGTSSTKTLTGNYSLSDTEGGSLGITQEISNKRAQHLVEYLDKQLTERLKKGLTKGLFHTAMYFTAEHKSTYLRLKNTLKATFQGSDSTMSPLEVYDLPMEAHGRLLALPTTDVSVTPSELLFHSLLKNEKNGMGSIVTAEELAIIASLPQHELQGIRRKKTVKFIVDLPDTSQQDSLDLGFVMDHGRSYPNNRVRLSRTDLNKHVIVTS